MDWYHGSSIQNGQEGPDNGKVEEARDLVLTGEAEGTSRWQDVVASTLVQEHHARSNHLFFSLRPRPQDGPSSISLQPTRLHVCHVLAGLSGC